MFLIPNWYELKSLYLDYLAQFFAILSKLEKLLLMQINSG